jgi:hypothetical protein
MELKNKKIPTYQDLVDFFQESIMMNLILRFSEIFLETERCLANDILMVKKISL